MTPFEESILQANFKAAMVHLRHCVASVTTESQAEYFYRDLEQECHRLVPKFRKGNQLSQLLAENRLPKAGASTPLMTGRE